MSGSKVRGPALGVGISMMFSSEVQGPALGSELGLLSRYLVQGRRVSGQGYAAILVPGLIVNWSVLGPS